jgi:hypothetical protein
MTRMKGALVVVGANYPTQEVVVHVQEGGFFDVRDRMLSHTWLLLEHQHFLVFMKTVILLSKTSTMWFRQEKARLA